MTDNKVVFLIPVFNDEQALMMSLQYFDKLSPQPQEYVFLENNSNDNSLGVLGKWKDTHNNVKIIRLWFRKDARYVLNSPFGIIGIVRQILLDVARKMDVNYAVSLDSDIMIGDTDFVKRIIRNGLDLFGGAYYRTSIHGKRSLCALTKYIDDKLPYYGLHDVYAVGAGCMVIGKKLLLDERVNFYPLIERKTYHTGEVSLYSSEDFGYCFQATDNGYRCYLDNTLNIGHYKKEYYRSWTRINGRYINFEYPE